MSDTTIDDLRCQRTSERKISLKPGIPGELCNRSSFCAVPLYSQSSTSQTQAATVEQNAPLQRSNNRFGAPARITYDNRFEIYGGFNLQTFQAGQNLPKRMNLGGVEVAGTYWLSNHWGAVAEFRGDAGTTPIFPNAQFNGRALVVLYTGMAGAEYRGPKSQRFAIDYHAYGGVSHGDFTETGVSAIESGLYTNRTKPMFAVGGSLDYNRSKNLALRLSPDLILEHFGTEEREFFAISGGVVYRFGHR
jgi:hypothetical protein